MSVIEKIYFSFSPKIRENILYIRNIKKPIKAIKKIKEIDNYSKLDVNNYLNYQENKRYFKSSIKKIALKTNDSNELAKYFYQDEITILKEYKILDNSPILICLVKNERKRLIKFLEHYKMLGIKNFVFIDNDSTDGTLELLNKTSNINLFQIKEQYTTIRRQAWLNKIISYYGFNKWYLIVDIDELLVYNDCERKNINELTKYLERNKIKRAKTLMIDMYADGAFLNIESNEEDFTKSYCYFDIDSYVEKKHKFFELVVGGVRQRVFNKYEKISPFLMKYALIYFEKGDIQYNSHFSYPFYKNFGQEIQICLLHYKFLPEDLEKIKKIVEKGNYASGSVEYKAYLKAYEQEPNLNFKNENSRKYINSGSLKEIALIKQINWKE